MAGLRKPAGIGSLSLPRPGAPSAAGRMGIELGHRENGHIDLGPFFRPRANASYDATRPSDASNTPFVHPTGIGGFLRRLLGDNADEMNAEYSKQDRDLEIKRREAQIKAGESKEVIGAEGEQRKDVMNNNALLELIKMDKDNEYHIGELAAKHGYDLDSMLTEQDFQDYMLSKTHSLKEAELKFHLDATSKQQLRDRFEARRQELGGGTDEQVAQSFASNYADTQTKEKLEREGVANRNKLIDANTQQVLNEGKQFHNLPVGINMDANGNTIKVSMNPDNPMEMKATRGTNLKPVGRIDLGQTTAPTTAVQPEAQPTMPNIPQPVIPQPTVPIPQDFRNAPINPTIGQGSLSLDQLQTIGANPTNIPLPGMSPGAGRAGIMQMLQSNPTALKHAQRLAGEIMVPTPQAP